MVATGFLSRRREPKRDESSACQFQHYAAFSEEDPIKGISGTCLYHPCEIHLVAVEQ